MIFWNIIKSWVCYRWAKLFGYQVMAEGQDQSDRLTKCESCPFHVEGICVKCGCLTYAKTMLNTEQCPDKRWLRVWRKRATVS